MSATVGVSHPDSLLYSGASAEACPHPDRGCCGCAWLGDRDPGGLSSRRLRLHQWAAHRPGLGK